MFPVHSDGLRPLCCHMLPSMLHNNHEAQSVCHSSPGNLTFWLYSGHLSNHSHLPVSLLWPQGSGLFLPEMLKLACADTSTLETVGFIGVGLMPLSCFLLILTSYSCIVYSILQILSAEGRHRAFSTCSAHLTAILLFYMPVVLIYQRPASSP